MDLEQNPFVILIAEDDEDDYILTMEALKEAGFSKEVHWVKDGEELIEYLHAMNKEKSKNGHPRKIILDLNMGEKNGREALEEIKTNPEFRHIPVIVLTSSKSEGD